MWARAENCLAAAAAAERHHDTSDTRRWLMQCGLPMRAAMSKLLLRRAVATKKSPHLVPTHPLVLYVLASEYARLGARSVVYLPLLVYVEGEAMHAACTLTCDAWRA